MLFVEGDAGVGKTALVEAVAATARSRVLRARPTAAEAASSFAGLHDLLQPVIGGLARLPVPQRRALAAALALEDSPGQVDPRLVALACLSLLASVDGAVLLAVDDWQWLDTATLAVLTFVLRRLDGGEVKAIATVRTGEADEPLAALIRSLPDGLALELRLTPLDRGALRELVHARTGEWLPPPALARLHDTCAGNPLLALELIRAPGAERATDVRRLLAPPARRSAAGDARAARATSPRWRNRPSRRWVKTGSRRRSSPTCSSATARGCASRIR